METYPLTSKYAPPCYQYHILSTVRNLPPEIMGKKTKLTSSDPHISYPDMCLNALGIWPVKIKASGLTALPLHRTPSRYKSPSCAERTQGDRGAEFPLPRTLNRVRFAHAGDLYSSICGGVLAAAMTAGCWYGAGHLKSTPMGNSFYLHNAYKIVVSG